MPSTRQPSFALLLGAAWLLVVLQLMAQNWADTATSLAGAVTGLALAIGLEGLPYLMVCTGAFAVRYVVDPKNARATSDYGLALATSSLAAFIIMVSPDHWTRGVCGAIAINWLALVAIGGFGFALAVRFASERPSVRFASVLVVGATAIALFAAIEPRCLRGPYAMVHPAVWPVWLSHVREMQPLLSLMAESPIIGIAIAAFPVAALVATVILARSLRADFGFLVAAAAFLASVVTTLAAVKGSPFAVYRVKP